MEKINIKKVELLRKLKTNLVIHEKIFKESVIIFKKNYISLMKERIKNGKLNKFEFHVPLHLPKNYAQDYKDAITMVDMDCRDIIVLSEEEFMKYILNKWDWMRTFKTSYYSNVKYCGGGYSGTSGSSGTSGTSGKVLKEYFGDDDEN